MGTTKCEAKGCRRNAAIRGLCRKHYDGQRSSKGVQRTDKTRREWAIRHELCFGNVPTWASPHGTELYFATDEERRRAWEQRRDELLQEYADGFRDDLPGMRPAAWWWFVAGREEPEEMEAIVFLAENGYLRPDEIAFIAKQAKEARERIGTEREVKGWRDPIDQRRVKLHEAVQEALKGKVK